MEIEFKDSVKPVHVRKRIYSPEQLEFLKSKVQDLIDAGFIYRNTTSNWACAPLVVPNPGKDRFRFTADLRPVNAQMKKNVWPMPNPEEMMGRLENAKYFLNLDFIHGYWQFPLAEDSRECQSFHTPFGIYTPNGVLHRCMNPVSYFQSSMELMFGQVELLIYLDGILGWTPEPPGVSQKLRQVFEVCKTRRLKLNHDKCKLITNEAQFCGCIINKDGVRFHPRLYEA